MRLAPNNSNTSETVVEVGRPNVLNTSSSRISVIITDKKIKSRFSKLYSSGRNIPFRATSIIPVDEVAPIKMPRLAIIKITFLELIFYPTAELVKFTASFATPTIRSLVANKNMITIIN